MIVRATALMLPPHHDVGGGGGGRPIERQLTSRPGSNGQFRFQRRAGQWRERHSSARASRGWGDVEPCRAHPLQQGVDSCVLTEASKRAEDGMTRQRKCSGRERVSQIKIRDRQWDQQWVRGLLRTITDSSSMDSRASEQCLSLTPLFNSASHILTLTFPHQPAELVNQLRARPMFGDRCSYISYELLSPAALALCCSLASEGMLRLSVCSHCIPLPSCWPVPSTVSLLRLHQSKLGGIDCSLAAL